jgi:Secretion system C-terminal sorting domain
LGGIKGRGGVFVFLYHPGEIDQNKPFKIYPNPVENNLHIILSNAYTGSVFYRIYNSIGINVLEGFIHPGNNNVDISSLTGGIYVMELQTGEDVFTTRFVCYH